MKVKLENISHFSHEKQMKILDWRNIPEVGKYFFSEKINEAEHKDWIQRQVSSESEKVFFITYNNQELGCVYLFNISQKHRTLGWGIFLSPENANIVPGVGAIAEYLIHEYIFSILQLEKINIEILDNNPSVLQLHKKFGYVVEGVRRKNIVKNGERFDVHQLGLFSCEWEAVKPRFKEMFKKYL